MRTRPSACATHSTTGSNLNSLSAFIEVRGGPPPSMKCTHSAARETGKEDSFASASLGGGGISLCRLPPLSTFHTMTTPSKSPLATVPGWCSATQSTSDSCPLICRRGSCFDDIPPKSSHTVTSPFQPEDTTLLLSPLSFTACTRPVTSSIVGVVISFSITPLAKFQSRTFPSDDPVIRRRCA